MDAGDYWSHIDTGSVVMRMRIAFAALTSLLALSGCTWFKEKFTSTGGNSNTYVSREKPKPEELIAYLNDNARQIDSIVVQQLDVDARRGVIPIGLSGWMAAQKPRNFRMGAKLPGSGGPAADIGSNDREFWFWMSKADPPYLFYCSHEETRHAQLPFPFHPEWVMEALGMATIPSGGDFRVDTRNRGTIELIENTRSLQGQPVQKITVFNSQTAAGTQPQVIARRLVDERGKEIAVARITEMQRDPRTGVTIPKKISFEYPAERISLLLTLDQATVNQPIESTTAQNWFTRPYLDGVQSYDLATTRRQNSAYPTGAVRPTSGGNTAAGLGILRGPRR